MDILNRSAVVLRPNPSFLEWCKLDDAERLAEGVFDTLRQEPCVHLVPDFEDDDEREAILREFWPALFEAMLSAWVTDEDLWPKEQTFEMFGEWFDVQTYAMIVDVYMDEAVRRRYGIAVRVAFRVAEIFVDAVDEHIADRMLHVLGFAMDLVPGQV